VPQPNTLPRAQERESTSEKQKGYKLIKTGNSEEEKEIATGLRRENDGSSNTKARA
jgi:hypothetical protein